MADLVTAIISSTCLCGLSMIIVKLCSMRQANEKYIFITQAEYEELKHEKHYFVEQPLPDYSEVDRLTATAPTRVPLK